MSRLWVVLLREDALIVAAGVVLAVLIGGLIGSVTSAVPEREINTILSKAYFWMLLIQPLVENQTNWNTF